MNYLAKQIKRRNLVITGIPEGENNNNELQSAIITFLKDNLICNLEDAHIENAGCLGSGHNNYKRPILLMLYSMRHRNEILKNKFKLKGSPIYINEELTLQERKKKSTK